MKSMITKVAIVLLALAAPSLATAQSTLEGKWVNPHHSVIVHVVRCGNALCGTVSWASPNNQEKGTVPGTQVLTDLRPNGDGTYSGNAYDPKHNMRGSATVRQLGPNQMAVKGCALLGLLCKEQRWTRVS